MTIARDTTSGEVVGQFIDNQPGVKDERGRIVDARPMALLLTRGGRYVTVPRSSVRLEELR